MKYLSVCSGIEAATVAWHPLGFGPVAFSEIEPFPSAVLAHHYPTVPNLGDMTRFREWPDDLAPDVLVGGTPCQSFSVAGLRKGMDDPRGNLALTFLAIADRYRPRWIVWENVPGVLSSSGGRDFGAFLGALGALGYGFAYRVLDAQFFGLAQRRKRVFVVGYLGDWRRAAAVLLEPESLCGDTPTRGQAGEGATRGVEIGPSGGRFTDVNPTLDSRAKDGFIRNQLVGGVAVNVGVAARESGPGFWTEDVIAGPLRAEDGRPSRPSEIITANAGVAATLGAATGGTTRPAGNANEADFCVIAPPISPALAARDYKSARPEASGASVIAFKIRQGCEGGGKGYLGSADREGTVSTGVDQHLLAPVAPLTTGYGSRGGDYEMMGGHLIPAQMAVRRLTPRECERLQGFPDDYTLIPFRKKDAADGPRYKALGNSMAVNVMRWIGERIAFVDTL